MNHRDILKTYSYEAIDNKKTYLHLTIGEALGINSGLTLENLVSGLFYTVDDLHDIFVTSIYCIKSKQAMIETLEGNYTEDDSEFGLLSKVHNNHDVEYRFEVEVDELDLVDIKPITRENLEAYLDLTALQGEFEI